MSKDKERKPAKAPSAAKRTAPNDMSPLDRMRDLTRRVVAVPKKELPPDAKRRH